MTRLDIVVARAQITIGGETGETHMTFTGVQDIDVVVEAIWKRASGEKVSEVKVGADQLGVVVLDAVGAPVYEILWADDQRSADDAAWCNKKFPAEWWIERIGDVPRTRHGITKLSWLHRSEPEVWESMARICGIDDFIRWRLLGSSLSSLAMSRSNFVNMGLGLSDSTGAHHEVLGLLDSAKQWNDVVPPLVEGGSTVGTRTGVEIVT